MKMIDFSCLVLTEIKPPINVHSLRNRVFEMYDRPSYGLSLCYAGQITYTMNGIKYVSDPNHVVFLPQGKNYSLYGDREGWFPVINFKCDDFCCETINSLRIDNMQACLKDFETINKLFLQNDNRLEIFSVFYDLLHKIAEEQRKSKTILAPVMQYIDMNIGEAKLTNADLAKQIGISEVYLRKLFLKEWGISPRQYILDLRIRKAKQLLSNTPFTVTAIAEECGFASLYHFCRTFRDRTGVTPLEYARKNKLELI